MKKSNSSVKIKLEHLTENVSEFMKILAIETSCDETGVAILRIKNSEMKILSNIVSSQVKIHQKYGGVYPFLAKREHQRNLPRVLKKALKEAVLAKSKSEILNLKEIQKIDLIAVTIGPGLEPCLWVGINSAKDLSQRWKKPLIPINHIEAHIYANFLNLSEEEIKKFFPAVCLIVSGGHTQLILMKDFGKYKILGETRDDAAGECFDKGARILGLGYPGGPTIARLAEQWKSKTQKSKINSKLKIKLPRPMIFQKNYDFSFSGLKTAILYHYKNQPPKVRKSKQYIQAMAVEIQQAIIDVLIEKTLRAAKEYKAKAIILGGGVAANEELRKQFKSSLKSQMMSPGLLKGKDKVGKKIKSQQFSNFKLLVPAKKFCTDNAVMVAVAAYFHWLKGKQKKLEKIEAKANQRL